MKSCNGVPFKFTVFVSLERTWQFLRHNINMNSVNSSLWYFVQEPELLSLNEFRLFQLLFTCPFGVQRVSLASCTGATVCYLGGGFQMAFLQGTLAILTFLPVNSWVFCTKALSTVMQNTGLASWTPLSLSRLHKCLERNQTIFLSWTAHGRKSAWLSGSLNNFSVFWNNLKNTDFWKLILFHYILHLCF